MCPRKCAKISPIYRFAQLEQTYIPILPFASLAIAIDSPTTRFDNKAEEEYKREKRFSRWGQFKLHTKHQTFSFLFFLLVDVVAAEEETTNDLLLNKEMMVDIFRNCNLMK